jgi:hypothetical protein
MCQQQGCAAHARSGQRGLSTGMAATNDDHIEFLGMKHVGQSESTAWIQRAEWCKRALDFTGAKKRIASRGQHDKLQLHHGHNSNVTI